MSEKYGGAREVAENMGLRVACLISKGTRAQAHDCARTPTRMHAHSCTHPRERAHTQRYEILLYCKNGFVNAPQCYVIRTLPVLFDVK